MGCLFSHQSDPAQPSRVNNNDKAVAQLKVTKDEVKRYERKLEANIANYKAAVKQCIREKNKEKALLVLKKQKYLEKNLDATRNELLNLEQLINDVESAQVQKNLVEALKEGNEFLKALNSQLTLDDVERVMQDTHEAIEYQNQVSEALAQQGFVADEDELLHELDQLDDLEALDYDLPEVPKNRLVPPEEAKHTASNKSEEKQPEALLESA